MAAAFVTQREFKKCHNLGAIKLLILKLSFECYGGAFTAHAPRP